ncbi:MAG: DUF4203 domain-containing protein [Opitutae bacterium]|nr:DUF4203 domain-containing protein [Opitutae bacterium]
MNFALPDSFTSLLHDYMRLVERTGPVAQAIVIGVGLLYCFAGFRIYKFLIALAGLVVGGAVGVLIAGVITHYSHQDQTTSLVAFIAAPLICAILGAWLATLLEIIAVFCQGLLVGGGLTALYLSREWRDSDALWVALVGIASGLLALWLRKLFIVVTTALGGGLVAALGLLGLTCRPLAEWGARMFQWNQYQTWFTVLAAAWALLAALGIIIQYHKPAKRSAEEKAPATEPETPAAAETKS